MTEKYIEWLEKYYHYVLMYTDLGREAKDYLNSRGINNNTIQKFKLGYSPKNVKHTLEFLKSKGCQFDDLVENKILTRYKSGNKEKLTDPFRNRIILPIRNFYGKTIGFGGRTMDSKNKIKYINSSENKIFSKGNNVYGLDLAKEEIKKKGYVILFEGYFDTITAHQANIKNCVSTLGTALTANQALLLKNITNNVVIAFDGDEAGIAASFKSASILKSKGFNIRITHIPDGQDPDNFIKKYGKKIFIKNVIYTAKPMIESFIETTKLKYDLSSPNERFSYANEVFNTIKTNDTQEVERILKNLGKTLNVPLKKVYKITKGGLN